MKKGRFLWSAHRITERQKAGKSRSIKEKQLKNSRSTVSKPLVARPSSPSADFVIKTPENFGFPRFFLSLHPKSSGEFAFWRAVFWAACRFLKKFAFWVSIFLILCTYISKSISSRSFRQTRGRRHQTACAVPQGCTSIRKTKNNRETKEEKVP